LERCTASTAWSGATFCKPPALPEVADFCFFFGLPRTLDEREDLLSHGLEITDIVPERHTQRGHAGEQSVRGSTATEHPPPAFNQEIPRSLLRGYLAKGRGGRNRGVSPTRPFRLIPRSLLRGGFIGILSYPSNTSLSLF